jgi:hypothetical protein
MTILKFADVLRCDCDGAASYREFRLDLDVLFMLKAYGGTPAITSYINSE